MACMYIYIYNIFLYVEAGFRAGYQLDAYIYIDSVIYTHEHTTLYIYSMYTDTHTHTQTDAHIFLRNLEDYW